MMGFEPHVFSITLHQSSCCVMFRFFFGSCLALYWHLFTSMVAQLSSARFVSSFFFRFLRRLTCPCYPNNQMPYKCAWVKRIVERFCLDYLFVLLLVVSVRSILSAGESFFFPRFSGCCRWTTFFLGSSHLNLIKFIPKDKKKKILSPFLFFCCLFYWADFFIFFFLKSPPKNLFWIWIFVI